jgi:hypothetical protein
MFTKALITLSLTCATLYAQPINDRPPPQDHEQAMDSANRDPSGDAESLKERLEQTLSFAKRIVEKHEAAIAQLEAGDDPREVMRSLRLHDVRGSNRLNRRISNDENLSRPAAENRKERRPQSPMHNQKALDDVRAFIADHLPVIDKQLSTIEQISPDATNQLLDRLAPKILEIMHLERENSAMSSLKLDELRAGLDYVEAAKQYRILLRTGEVDQDKLDQAEEAVRVAASARFDAQVHIKQYEIHQLTMRIEQLHIALDELNSERDDQVQAQINAARRTPGPRFNRQAEDSETKSSEDD